MLLTILIQLYTVRVTLRVLGVENYGIYNVVCGITNALAFITHSMNSASQRFFSYALGKNNLSLTKKTFDSMLIVFIIMGIVMTIAIKIAGGWFIQNKMVIDGSHIAIAMKAFDCSILMMLLSTITLPFMALIIAHEDMKIFAYISICDLLMRLFVVLGLTFIDTEKLVLYAMLNCMTYMISTVLYAIYCFRHYDECDRIISMDMGLIKKILPYMSWSLFGGISWMLCTHGLSVMVNLFFGPIANAAKAIADKINSTISGFANNFMQATQPQIVKTYAVRNFRQMHDVIYMSSNWAFYLMLIIAVPFIVNAKSLLSIWLGNCDNLTVWMSQLALAFSFTSTLENPISQAIRATGNIRNYQMSISVITLSVLPLAYLFFKKGYPAYYGYISLIITYSTALFLRIYFLKKYINISYCAYFNNVVKRPLLSLGLIIILIYSLRIFVQDNSSSFLYCVTLLATDATISVLIIFFTGLRKHERDKLVYFAKNTFHGLTQ